MPPQDAARGRPDRPADRQHHASTCSTATCQPVPVGVAGELLHRRRRPGPRLLGRPELTAERFVPDPFGAEPGARLYRTGDLARCLPDGDDRVPRPPRPPGQAARLPHRAGRDRGGPAASTRPCAQAVVAGARGRPRRPTRWSPTSSPQRAGAELAWRAARAPATPAAGVHGARGLRRRSDAAADAQRQGRPRGAARRRRAPRGDRGATSRRARPPSELLVAICGPRSSGVDASASTTTSSTSAGTRCSPRRLWPGSAPRLASSCRCAALFEAPTVARPRRGGRRGADGGRPRRARAGAAAASTATAPLPLSFAQERLWFLDQLSRAARPTTFPRSSSCGASWTSPLCAALCEQIAAPPRGTAHDVHDRDGQPVQVVAARRRPRAAARRSRRGLPEAERRARAQALGQTEVLTPVRPRSAGRCCASRLLRLGAEEHWLLLTIHHIVADGGRSACSCASWRRSTGGRHRSTGRRCRRCPCSTPTTPCGSASGCRGSGSSAQLAYWRERLRAPLPVLDLPTDRPRPSCQTTRGGVATACAAARAGD